MGRRGAIFPPEPALADYEAENAQQTDKAVDDYYQQLAKVCVNGDSIWP